MQLTVEYHCGHSIRETRFGGKYAEQLQYAKERLDCPECYRTRKQAEREAQHAEMREQASDLPLVELAGSPKQIAWANDIRAKVLTEIRAAAGRITTEAERGKVAQLLDILARKPEAKWWIEQREQSSIHLAAAVAKAEGIIPERTAP